MRYNPQIHHRRSIRLKGYDYAKAGAYFITICCHKMECRFGQIMTGTDNVGAGFTSALGIAPAPESPAATDRAQNHKPAILGDIIGAYKSLAAKGCLNIYKTNNDGMGKLWHRNFHEHIIRNEKSYQKISNYIINNPSNWNDDKFYKPE
jgi:hypothetical protein